MKLVQRREEINPNPAEVGKAVYKTMQCDQPQTTVEEIIEGYKDDYTKQMQESLEAGIRQYNGRPFHVVVLHKKEPWAMNVLRNWFINRESRPLSTYLRRDYANHSHTVYSFDPKTSQLKILWNLPTAQDSLTIITNKQLYDPQLVTWIQDYQSGKLDRGDLS